MSASVKASDNSRSDSSPAEALSDSSISALTWLHRRNNEPEALLSDQDQFQKVVFDCMDYPPQSMKRDGDTSPYIDENDLVELPATEDPVDHRKYYPYGPTGQQSGFN